MKFLVTGSAGHLGEALVRTLRGSGESVVGLDVLASACTDRVGSIADRRVVQAAMDGVEVVLHAATLHKPHVGTHSRQQFIDTNLTGTLNLLEEAVAAGVRAFVYTSTTSVFGDALVPPPGAPAAWITESVVPVPKNIYGVTKAAAEHLCQLFHRNQKLPCVVLRTSRFFPEADDDKQARSDYSDENLKVIEFLYRRVEIEDVVRAHLAAAERAPALGFGKYIISATSPFQETDVAKLRRDAPSVVRRYVPEYVAEFKRRGWKMPRSIGRVYVNARARQELGWAPHFDFATLIARLSSGKSFRSPLAEAIGSKGYHDQVFADGPFPTG